MGIVSRIMRPIKNLSVTDEKAWSPSLWNLLSAQSNSGININEHTALTYSAVFCAISLISGTIATLPLRLLQQKEKTKEPATRKKLYRVMHSKANPYMTAMAFRECLAAHALSWGNGYAEIVKNKLGEIVEMWPITPNRVTLDMESGDLVYKITVSGEIVTLPRERVLHIPGLGFDGFQGYSVISLARESIGLGMAMEKFGAQFFGQGAHPGLVVSHPTGLSETAHKNLSRELSEKYVGLGKSHRLMLLEEGMKLEKVGVSQEDSQFLESRQFQIPEIARWFNLPPHKLKDLTKSSFSNIESEQISFVTESILPWLIRFEQNYDMQLLSDKEIEQGHFFKHNVEGLLRGDAKSRAEFYRTMWNIGAMSINDIREKEDFDPVEGGDEHFIPLNMVPLSKAGEMADAQIKKSQEKPDDSEPSQPVEPDDKQAEPGRKQGKRSHLIPV
jgi:HK97 family phage portal protein